MTILGFKRTEIIVVAAILAIVGAATYANLTISMRRARDMQRRDDLWTIHDALIAYHEDFSEFPHSQDGAIIACAGGTDELGLPIPRACDWYRDGLPNILTGQTYLSNLPTDPQHNRGSRYYYISTGRYFQIYAALEGQDEDGYNEGIIARNIMCGNRICNFGRAFGQTPLDKSIEEYENELRELQKARDEESALQEQ